MDRRRASGIFQSSINCRGTFRSLSYHVHVRESLSGVFAYKTCTYLLTTLWHFKNKAAKPVSFRIPRVEVIAKVENKYATRFVAGWKLCAEPGGCAVRPDPDAIRPGTAQAAPEALLSLLRIVVQAPRHVFP